MIRGLPARLPGKPPQGEHRVRVWQVHGMPVIGRSRRAAVALPDLAARQAVAIPDQPRLFPEGRIRVRVEARGLSSMSRIRSGCSLPAKDSLTRSPSLCGSRGDRAPGRLSRQKLICPEYCLLRCRTSRCSRSMRTSMAVCPEWIVMIPAYQFWGLTGDLHRSLSGSRF